MTGSTAQAGSAEPKSYYLPRDTLVKGSVAFGIVGLCAFSVFGGLLATVPGGMAMAITGAGIMMGRHSREARGGLAPYIGLVSTTLGAFSLVVAMGFAASPASHIEFSLAGQAMAKDARDPKTRTTQDNSTGWRPSVIKELPMGQEPKPQIRKPDGAADILNIMAVRPVDRPHQNGRPSYVIISNTSFLSHQFT